jgi:hypothetical protein
VVEVNVCPTTTLPETAGGTVLVGAVSSSATGPTASDVAEPVPAAFVATTDARSEDETSVGVTAYDEFFAPETDVQFAPAPSQRFHWKLYDVVEPDHDPGETVSDCPTDGEPLTCGSDVFVGAVVGDPTGAVGSETAPAVASETASVEPFLFDAMTLKRRNFPRSAAAAVYVVPFAFEIALHAPTELSQRCH